jgi:uncharacterized membrane protein YjjP (DUF1212 family)
MSRRIITSEMQAANAGSQLDTYFDKVLKYIPADINAGWVAVVGLIHTLNSGNPDPNFLWIIFAVFVVITAVWIFRHTTKPNMPPPITQTAISTVAFIVWVIALGGPFASIPGYEPAYGGVLLVLFTLGVGAINPPES